MQLVLDKSNHQVHKHYEYWIASSWSEMWSSPERYIWPCPSPPRPDSICGSPVTFSSSLLFRHAAFGFRLRSEQNHSDQIWMMMMITEWWRSSSQTCIMKEEQVGGRTCLAHNSSQKQRITVLTHSHYCNVTRHTCTVFLTFIYFIIFYTLYFYIIYYAIKNYYII